MWLLLIGIQSSAYWYNDSCAEFSAANKGLAQNGGVVGYQPIYAKQELQVHMCVCVCRCVCVCACVQCVCVCICVFVFMHGCACMCLCVHVCMCLYVCRLVHASHLTTFTIVYIVFDNVPMH